MICPYCQFERIGKYDNPDWECPSCNKVYKKFKPEDLNLEESIGLNRKSKPRPYDGLIMWAVALLFIYSVVASLFDGQTTSICSKVVYPCRIATLVDQPIEFTLLVLIKLTIGLWIFKKIFTNTN